MKNSMNAEKISWHRAWITPTLALAVAVLLLLAGAVIGVTKVRPDFAERDRAAVAEIERIRARPP